MNLKKQFLDYLRQAYGAESTVLSQGMPPIEVGLVYPAFNRSMGSDLSMLAQSTRPASSFKRLQVGGPRQPREELGAAQDILLGG